MWCPFEWLFVNVLYFFFIFFFNILSVFNHAMGRYASKTDIISEEKLLPLWPGFILLFCFIFFLFSHLLFSDDQLLCWFVYSTIENDWICLRRSIVFVGVLCCDYYSSVQTLRRRTKKSIRRKRLKNNTKQRDISTETTVTVTMNVLLKYDTIPTVLSALKWK